MAQKPVSYIDILLEMFPNKTKLQISEIVEMVINGSPLDSLGDSFEQNVENMVMLLYGDPCPDPCGIPPEILDEGTIQGDDDEEGAVGYGHQASNANVIYNQLVNVFPDASTAFLWRFCQDRLHGLTINEAIDILTTEGYDRLELDPLVLWDHLKVALPGADPSYLKKQAEKLVTRSQYDIDQFITNAVENNDYPTMKEYLKQKEEKNKLLIYTPEYFSLEKYLEVVPNPEEKFGNKDREPSVNLETGDPYDNKYAQTFLYNQYRFIRTQHIDRVFRLAKGNLTQACDILDRLRKGLKTPRDFAQLCEIENLNLLQEVTFLKQRRLINRFVKDKDETYKKMKEEARKFNLLETCACCFDDELIPEECVFCMKGCVFCKQCVRKGVETLIGEAKNIFPCFANCSAEFSLRALQIVLPSKTFQSVVRRLQSEQIKKANIEGLETCPFCDFAKPLPDGEKIFKCENPDCAIESCRECRHESHIPKRCDEIEYDEDVRRRTYIENKMTEAFTRTCYSCKKPFIKTNGCNKMTCSCGAKMCYLCNAAIKDYSHFGSDAARCSMFTDDNAINLTRVLQNVAQAKAELGNVDVKFDPSINIENYFRG